MTYSWLILRFFKKARIFLRSKPPLDELRTIFHNSRRKFDRGILNLIHKAVVTAADAPYLPPDAIKMDERVRYFSDHIIQARAETATSNNCAIDVLRVEVHFATRL